MRQCFSKVVSSINYKTESATLQGPRKQFAGDEHTDGLLPLASGGGEPVEPLVSYAGLVEAERVSRLFVEGWDVAAAALFGDLLACLLERAGHCDG